MYTFSYWVPVCCSMSSSTCCFLTCIHISQEAGQVVWYSHLLKNFPQFVVIHAVKWRRQWHPTPVFLPGEFQGRGSLVGCRQWQQLELDMEQQTGSKSGKEYIKAVYCHPDYLTSMQSTSWACPNSAGTLWLESEKERKPKFPVSPRAEALFHCARPSRVPRVTANSTGSLASQRYPGKFPKVPGRRRGKRGFPAALQQRLRESFFNASRGPSPLPRLESHDALALATRMET